VALREGAVSYERGTHVINCLCGQARTSRRPSEGQARQVLILHGDQTVHPSPHVQKLNSDSHEAGPHFETPNGTDAGRTLANCSVAVPVPPRLQRNWTVTQTEAGRTLVNCSV